MHNIKTIFTISIISIILVLFSTVVMQRKKINKINFELSNATINNKAYRAENDTLKRKSIQFIQTIEELNYSNDSLMRKLNNIRKELKIKDRDIKELQYIASLTSKKDSILIKDTIFIKEDFQLDTTIRDDWSRLNLKLKHPNIISADYSFKNETFVVASSKKETIKPPKKLWICRIFQKKHKVIMVDVIQKNPYCETTKDRHIKIIE